MANCKFVYVLTSSQADFYYEQFFISVASLRLFNPGAEIIVLVDGVTNASLTGNRTGYEKYISGKTVISAPKDMSQKEASRWIKTSVNQYVSGDFLFIDCDTVIAEKLEPAFSAEIKIGAILDTHTTLDRHHLKNNFQKEDIKAGFSSSLKTNTRYNGGIIFYRDAPEAKNFYQTWHRLWLESRQRGCSQDMPSLNQANYEKDGIIKDLGGEWNCQISHNGLPFLSYAKIIHYFATSLVFLEPAYKFASKEILLSIKKKGELSPEIIKLLENPKGAFEPFSRIISDKKTIEAIDHSLYFKLLRFINKRFGF